MIITVTLNPAIDKTVEIDHFALNAVNRVKAMRTDPGGKGINVSKVVAALGGQTVACGLLGGAAGEQIKQALSAYNVSLAFTKAPYETRTNLKIVDRLNRTNTDVNESGAAVTPELLEAVFSTVCARARPGDTVVLAGKNPPGTPDGLLASWVRLFKRQDLRVFVDTVGAPMLRAIEEKPFLIKPNAEELSELFGRPLEGRPALLAAARELNARGVALVVVSLGGDGALFVTSSRALHAHGLKVPVGSTVGAGDSMTASIAFDLERGKSLEDAARCAVAVSAANVMCSGTQPAELSAILPLVPQVELEPLD